MIGAAWGGGYLEIPVDPDAPEAKRLVLEELSKPGYAEAQPSLFDRVSQAIYDWVMSLFTGGIGAPGGLLPALIVTLVVVAVVVAVLIWGVPRLNRRSAATAETVFGDDDVRDAATIRRDAATAAAAGDFSLATTERFRAIARGLSERTVVRVTPGTTAHEVAARAGGAFPDLDSRLRSTARVFDEVRYLGVAGTRESYDDMSRLDDELAHATPALAGVASAGAL